jgi:hypothetical protein
MPLAIICGSEAPQNRPASFFVMGTVVHTAEAGSAITHSLAKQLDPGKVPALTPVMESITGNGQFGWAGSVP